MEAEDFEFIKSLMDQFLSQKYISQKLACIAKDSRLSGWEIWMQIEFGMFLDSQKEIIPCWEREVKFELDQRSNAERKSTKIDFLIRRKFARSNKLIALELKQDPDLNQCIDRMMKDAEILFCIKPSQFDIRSVVNVGIHPTKPQNEVFSKISKQEERWNLGIKEGLAATNEIAKTGLSYTIF